MFVSVTCDLASDDSRFAVYSLLKEYGFRKIFKDLFEITSIKENTLARLKRDIDKKTDFYDKIRIYQYPVDDTMAISSLEEKKWKKFFLRT